MKIESDRLVICQADSPWIKANPSWLRQSFQGILKAFIPPESNLSYGIYLHNGQRIGRIRMMRFADQWEIGYRIKKAHRHRGYASEAVKAFLPAFMDENQVFRILAVSSDDNLPSQAVLKKAGFLSIPDSMGRPILSKSIKFGQYLLTAYPKDQIVHQEAIHKGWSGDRKYKVTMADGQTYLLRLSPGEKSQQKAREFRAMWQLSHLQLVTVRPFQVELLGEEVGFLQEWIEGKDLEDLIPHLTQSQQYLYGREAGRTLRLIHSLPAPPALPAWAQSFNKKIERKIQDYKDCGLKYPNDHAFLDFIKANRHRLGSRPQTLQHGDFHIGNMMIDQNDRLRIIDFDRMDYGDPWEEFNRIVFTAQLSPVMASGMLDAYFQDQIPPDFWPLLALYIAVNTLSALPWALTFGQADVDRMHRLADQVMVWYEGMTQAQPSWYQKAISEENN